MTVKGGPKIETDGLVFHLDAASSSIGKGYSTEGLKVEYLVVAGGGGGSGWGDGVGGGAGGFLSSETNLAAGTYTVTVGAGGNRGTNSSASRGSNGGDSQLGSIVAYGGGGAGCKSTQDGLAGGSGGGGYGNNNVPHGVGGSGVAGQGHDGGDGINYYRGGSGGGAGGPGIDGVNAPSNGLSKVPGGIGKVAKIDFVWQYYAGGGGVGGCCSRGDGSGGLGGGGSGGDTNTDGIAGETNTGGGGGGGGSYFNRATYGGNGGSGIVMIRYRGKQKATGGDTIQYKNGYTIHTFTSSGSFVLSESVDGTSSNKIVGELINMDSSNYKSGNKGYWNLATDEYIDCSNHVDDLIFSSPATVSTWLMPLHDKNTGSTFFFIGNDATAVTDGTGAYGFLIRYGSTTGALTGETFVVYRYDGGNAGHQLTLYGISNGYEYQNQWVNATVVVESNTWKLYVNGILQTLTRGTFWTGAQFKYGENMSPKNKAVIGTSGANIRLADTKVYNTALTQQQILDNYNATKGRFGL